MTDISKPGHGVIAGAFSPDDGKQMALVSNIGTLDFIVFLASPNDFNLAARQGAPGAPARSRGGRTVRSSRSCRPTARARRHSGTSSGSTRVSRTPSPPSPPRPRTRPGSRSRSVAESPTALTPAALGGLVLVLPDGSRVPITSSLTIGRGEEATVRISDQTVSRLHVKINLGAGRCR